MGKQIKREVGYAVRFDDQTSDVTRLKFMTEGVLLKECVTDPLISKYAVIILDEAHERNVNMDILFGLMKKVIFMFAT